MAGRGSKTTESRRVPLSSDPNICGLYLQLGFPAPIWDMTRSFMDQIEACVDPASIEGDGVASIRDRSGLQAILQEAEGFLRHWANSVRDRREFDEAIQLLTTLQGIVAEDQPVRSSMVADLLAYFWVGRNWGRLEEPMNERRKALDRFIRRAGLAGDRWMTAEHPTIGDPVELRRYSLLTAAQSYVTNSWMHTPWLTTVIACAMLSDLWVLLCKRERSLSRWWHHPLAFAGGGLILWDLAGLRSLGILFLAAAAVEMIALWRVKSVRWRLAQISSEVSSGAYSGRVLAERLERLNGPTLGVPSVLPEVLRS
jgi:hypothetical protein